MSRRSCRNTLQERDENTTDQNTCPRKRKAEQCKRKTPVLKKQSYEIQGTRTVSPTNWWWYSVNCLCVMTQQLVSVTVSPSPFIPPPPAKLSFVQLALGLLILTCALRNRWMEGDVSPCVLVETPHKELEETSNLSGFKHFRFKNLFIKPSPLPCLSWASSDDVWIKMLNKELKYIHDKTFMGQHPSLQPKMRAILLDWLIEVSEVYMLHRETFYLAQDFFDRFMLTQVAVGKNQLQLIGITSLFIASKLEEIYPPKLQEFAYVTDGACDEDEILEMELIMLKALNWDLCPETPISWLKLYAQLGALKEGPSFLVPQFSQETYIQMTQLLDLCILDINALDYQYGVLAGAAFCHFTSIETVQKVTGLTWDSISSCVRWMAPFVRTVNEYGQPKLKDFKKVPAEDRHNIQTHMDYLSMLNDAQQRQQDNQDRLSPVAVGGLLTPPKSTEKPINV